ncbi:MAG TPA: hypothetical protein VH640_04105 [Bryobacteraceae bacterium]
MIKPNAFAAFAAVSLSLFAGGPGYADTLQFGVIGSPIDLSANVSESILPGGMIFQESKPLFGTAPDPKQSAELLHLSSTGVNPSTRSKVSGAFASSLAESNGNGGVGASQLIFGSPSGSTSNENVVRQLVAQSLWTQTFLYTGTPIVDIKLHLQIPALQVELWGIPPLRDNPSSTETAQASAQVDTVITHSDGTFSKGGSFEFGLREFETQIPEDSGGALLNFADLDLIGTDGPLFASLHEDLDFPADRVRWRIDSVSTDVNLGLLHTGDTLAYVYTLTAEGTTHGFERGYDAFLGDPFGADVVTGNLGVTVALADVPEANTGALTLLGLAGLFVWRWHRLRARRSISPR